MFNTDLHKYPVGVKKDFIETLKHELKTPVIAQIRILELLLSGRFGKLKFEQSEILKLSLDTCEYMYKILSDIICTQNSENILFAQKLDKTEKEFCLFLVKESPEKNII